MPALPADAVEVGRILGAWGIKGGIKVKPFAANPQALFSSKRWYLQPADPPRPAPPHAPPLPPLLRVLQAQMCIRDRSTPGPWQWHPDWSLVVVDECERLDTDLQQQAFALFVEALDAGVQWAAAGRLPPVDLRLREDLGTRLAWGHVFALQNLGEAESRAVLRRDADRRGIFLSDEVMDYLLSRFPRDLAHLGRLLARLDGYGLARSRRITLPLLRDMLAEDGQGTVGAP